MVVHSHLPACSLRAAGLIETIEKIVTRLRVPLRGAMHSRLSISRLSISTCDIERYGEIQDRRMKPFSFSFSFIVCHVGCTWREEQYAATALFHGGLPKIRPRLPCASALGSLTLRQRKHNRHLKTRLRNRNLIPGLSSHTTHLSKPWSRFSSPVT